MNKAMVRSVVLGLVMTVVSLPLFAQTSGEESDETVAKVQTDGGVIMISDPGEFSTAQLDQRVHKDARLMVSEESSATVIYDNGCRKTYDEPGVYEISAKCVPAILASSSAKGWIIGGVITGVALYYIIEENGNDDPSPVSR